jgi:sugar/nucleoside kinase (ribokinase family)
MNKVFDVLTIGQPLLDAVVDVDVADLGAIGVEAGESVLLTSEQLPVAAHLMEMATFWSAGGSAANTASAVAQLGHSSAFIGSLGTDPAAGWWKAALEDAGVSVHTSRRPGPTGVCVILRPAGKQRTMLTSLGAGSALQPSDVPDQYLRNSRTIYTGAYLLGRPNTRAVLDKVVATTNSAAGVRTAFTLAGEACVRDNRTAIQSLMQQKAFDVWIGTDREWQALLFPNFENSERRRFLLSAMLREKVALGVVTLGDHGSLIVDRDETSYLPAQQVRLVDDIGAGDGFAAGFLVGLTAGRNAREAAALGVMAAASAVEHPGGQTPRNLSGHQISIAKGDALLASSSKLGASYAGQNSLAG